MCGVSQVILIGNPHVLACDPHWRELLQTIMGNGGCRGSSLPASLSEDNAEDAHERETAGEGSRQEMCG